MNRKSLVIGLAFSCVIILGSGKAYAQEIPSAAPTATLLVTGMESGSGSTIGPGGALYVTEGAAGQVLRVDPEDRGRLDVRQRSAEVDHRHRWGDGHRVHRQDRVRTGHPRRQRRRRHDNDVDGIYRVDGPDSFTVVADIGEFSSQNPPDTDFSRPDRSPVRNGEATVAGSWSPMGTTTVCCGSHCDGEVTELITFDNIVPTGLEVSGNTVYMAEAGPVPHLPQDGKVVSFGTKSPTATEVASGARLLVDVEFGRGRGLFALCAGRLRGRRCRGCSGAAEHRQPPEGQRRWHLQRRLWTD